MAATPIEELIKNSLAIECLGRFAVDTYNIKENALVLEFMKVLQTLDVKAVVLGVSVRLNLEAVDRGEKRKKKVCQALVLVKPDHSKVLEEFKIIGDA